MLALERSKSSRFVSGLNTIDWRGKRRYWAIENSSEIVVSTTKVKKKMVNTSNPFRDHVYSHQNFIFCSCNNSRFTLERHGNGEQRRWGVYTSSTAVCAAVCVIQIGVNFCQFSSTVPLWAVTACTFLKRHRSGKPIDRIYLRKVSISGV